MHCSYPEQATAVFGAFDEAYRQATVAAGLSCVPAISLKKTFEDIVASAEVYVYMYVCMHARVCITTLKREKARSFCVCEILGLCTQSFLVTTPVDLSVWRS